MGFMAQEKRLISVICHQYHLGSMCLSLLELSHFVLVPRGLAPILVHRGEGHDLADLGVDLRGDLGIGELA